MITQATEHPAVLQTGRALERLHGARVTVLPVDSEGLVDPAALEDALTTETVLVSVMAANNETGALQPITELTALARGHGALLHCDAAQTAGKIPIDVRELGVDLLTLVGHKMYAPKATAALYVRDGVRLEPVVHSGGQERGLRAGTENVALALLASTAQIAASMLPLPQRRPHPVTSPARHGPGRRPGPGCTDRTPPVRCAAPNKPPRTTENRERHV